MLRRIKDRLTGIVRSIGWADGCVYVAARAIQALSLGRAELRKYYFVSQPIPSAPLLPKNRGASIVVERIARQHPLVSAFPRPSQVIADRFDNDAICFLATKNGEFVGFLWLQAGSYREDEVRCLFTPLPARRAIWDFDVHIEPAYRSSFAFARLWDTANQYLRDQDVCWSVSRISAFNAGSINAHARLGAFPIGAACFLKGRTWQLTLSSSPAFFHFSSGEHAVPQISLPAAPEHRRRYRRFSRHG
ncbi:GNAT family N-acetyltransferase [Roseateles sp. LYH14W]|uniref:GNAT family N-acetyltransferase n=1 Tax=Pelomonas parva TaxID=3299032 RepID=A0ABW7EW83_9BURK